MIARTRDLPSQLSQHPVLVALLLLWLTAGLGCAGSTPDAAMDTASDPESITNNQEDGVDEGGIVKAWGDYLVVLRRGRLFTVRLGDQDLRPICRVDVFPAGSRLGTWYDELLLSDRAAVVVGYSYNVGATELGLFELSDDGCIAHRETYFLQSNDYYSSRNYASRVVDGRLVFYMPHYLGSYATDAQGNVTVGGGLPSFGRYSRDQRYAWNAILDQSAIQPPVGDFDEATLHTVVTCDLTTSTMSCRAQGMMGGSGRTFYVSREAVYVWTHDAYGGAAGEPSAVVYRLPLDGGEVGALHAWGAPVDQFSFRERGGYLDVVVREVGGGDWMWGPEWSEGRVALAHLPLSGFTPQGGDVKPTAYTQLPEPEGYQLRNRFVGDYLLYGASQFYAQDSGLLYVHALEGRQQTATLRLSHAVERIEALGDDAVVIGPNSEGLAFSAIALGASRVVDVYVQAGAVQGEERSHGFFFLPDREREGSGMVGLPIRSYGAWEYSFLVDTSVGVLFLEVDALHFTELGGLGARDDTTDDDCQVSCVDWYGNSRPIFYRGRVFALMGYELVEGIVRNDRMFEIGRVNLFADLS